MIEKPILLVGAGGHCKSCIDVIESSGNFKVRGIVEKDGFQDWQKSVLGYSVIGTDSDLRSLIESTHCVLISLGHVFNAQPRIHLYEKAKQFGAFFPVVISSCSAVSRHSEIGSGSIIMHGAIVNASARIKENCIVNSRALIEHDVVIGNHCHISTGSLLNGEVLIGDNVFIGSGVVIREGVRIGDNATVRAGQIVKSDVPDGASI